MWERGSAEHTFQHAGLRIFRLRYRIDRIAGDAEPGCERSLRTVNTANRLEFMIYIWIKVNVANSEPDEFLGR